jgi:hypothetical protein
MATERTFTYRYEHDADAVAQLLRDPSYLKARCEAAGERNVEIQVEPQGDAVRVIVARDRTTSLPSFAKKLYRGDNRVVDDTLWRRQGDRWVGEYTITIGGAPGTIRGRSELVPDGAGCTYESRFEVTATVPLLAGKVEAFVAESVASGLLSGAQRNAERLASL